MRQSIFNQKGLMAGLGIEGSKITKVWVRAGAERDAALYPCDAPGWGAGPWACVWRRSTPPAVQPGVGCRLNRRGWACTASDGRRPCLDFRCWQLGRRGMQRQPRRGAPRSHHHHRPQQVVRTARPAAALSWRRPNSEAVAGPVHRSCVRFRQCRDGRPNTHVGPAETPHRKNPHRLAAIKNTPKVMPRAQTQARLGHRRAAE